MNTRRNHVEAVALTVPVDLRSEGKEAAAILYLTCAADQAGGLDRATHRLVGERAERPARGNRDEARREAELRCNVGADFRLPSFAPCAAEFTAPARRGAIEIGRKITFNENFACINVH